MMILIYLQSNYCEETADVASQTAVSLQSLEPDANPESSIHNASQYAAVYQALDPKTLEWIFNHLNLFSVFWIK